MRWGGWHRNRSPFILYPRRDEGKKGEQTSATKIVVKGLANRPVQQSRKEAVSQVANWAIAAVVALFANAAAGWKHALSLERLSERETRERLRQRWRSTRCSASFSLPARERDPCFGRPGTASGGSLRVWRPEAECRSVGSASRRR